MDTRQLEYIVTIAETGSLSLAADKLYITQSALSQQLAKLKDEGLPPLFREEKRRMVLTDAGKIYLNGARAILRTEQLARLSMNSLSVQDKPVFNISVAPYLQTVFLSSILPILKKQFPDITIHILINNTENTRNLLEDGTLDMAFIPDIYQQRDFYTYIHIYRDELVIASPFHDMNSDSAAMSQFTIPAAGSYLRDICNRIFSNQNYIPDIYAETNDPNTMLELVGKRECNAIVPRSFIKIKEIKISSFKDPAFFYLTCIHKKAAASPIIDAAVKEIKRYFVS